MLIFNSCNIWTTCPWEHHVRSKEIRKKTHKQLICHFLGIPHCSIYQVSALTNSKISNLAAESPTHSPRGSWAPPAPVILLCHPLTWLMHVWSAVDYHSSFQSFFFFLLPNCIQVSLSMLSIFQILLLRSNWTAFPWSWSSLRYFCSVSNLSVDLVYFSFF